MENVHLAVDDDLFAHSIDSVQAAKHTLEENVTDVSHSTPGHSMPFNEHGPFYERCRGFSLHVPMAEESDNLYR